MTNIKTITVYCGSSSGNKPIFTETATQFANAMCAHDFDLVYGGASVGLMGTVADTMLAKDKRVIGIITEALLDVEIAHPHLTEQQVVSSMHERKAIMHDLGDAFVILPGGSGSMDEFFEIHTWAQLGYHTKPIGLLNVEGYYEPIKDFYKTAVSNGFIKAEHADMLIFESDPEVLIQKLQQYKSAFTPKWIED